MLALTNQVGALSEVVEPKLSSTTGSKVETDLFKQICQIKEPVSKKQFNKFVYNLVIFLV